MTACVCVCVRARRLERRLSHLAVEVPLRNVIFDDFAQSRTCTLRYNERSACSFSVDGASCVSIRLIRVSLAFLKMKLKYPDVQPPRNS